MIFDVVTRLEPDPHQRNLARGWAAELADPVWMLGRQWQMGEHLGEDASSPVAVEITSRATPIEPIAGQLDLDPATVPAEIAVESEPHGWWTTGRRVRAGRSVAAAATAAGVVLRDDGSIALGVLPVPYDGLDPAGPDGRALWTRRGELGLDDAWFGDAPPSVEPVDMWDPARLAYHAEFRSGDATLVVDGHDGGDLDWFSADAVGDLGASGTTTTTRTTPGRLRYPSAPLPRWWQIEDHQVSIGGQAPDRAALATLVLIDLVVNHSDDCFTFAAPARAGEIVTFDQVVVIDDFGDSWSVTPPTDWSLFGTTGLDARSLVVWSTARSPLVGPVLDSVAIGLDEDANAVWAVEQIVAGRTLATPATTPAPVPAVVADSAAPSAFSYRPMTPIPPHWHPYVLDDTVVVDGAARRRFVQGRAADLSGRTPTLLPPPVSDLLSDPTATPDDPVHQLDPAVIPAEGIQIERRAMLARATTGAPLLWTQRRRIPLVVPPSLTLRFDVLEPDDRPADGGV